MPHGWALELGEILYNLRAALDGAIYESAIIESGKNPPPDHNRLEFPIYGCAEYFNKAGWKIARLSQRCRDFIESMQPYHAPELQPGLMVFNVHRNLAILNDWARKDRYRALHVMGCWAFGASPKLRLPAGATLKYLRATGDGFLDERRDIATFAIEGYIRGMNVQANPDQMIEIGVKEGPDPEAENDTLGNRLTEMIRATKLIVLELEKVALGTAVTPGTQI